MKADLKKFEEIDVFISGNTTPEESKAFSEFLKTYKATQARNKKDHHTPSRAVIPSGEKMKSKARVKHH